MQLVCQRKVTAVGSQDFLKGRKISEKTKEGRGKV